MRSTQVFPKKDGWATPRTDEIQLTDENCQIILPKKIDRITKVTLSTEYGGYISDIQASFVSAPDTLVTYELYLNSLYKLQNGQFVPLTEIDITPLVLEKKEWDTAPMVDISTLRAITQLEIGKNNTFYYEHGSNVITLQGAKYKGGALFSRLVMDELVQYATFLTQETQNLYTYTEGEGYNVFTGKASNKSSHTNPLNKNYQDIHIRVEYIPIGESAKVTANKTETLQTKYLTPYSQTQPLVSSQQFGKNMTATANRTGVETRTVCRKVRNYTNIRQVGTIWQETDVNGAKTGNTWRLTVNDIKYVGGFYDCTETWAKNWSSQSEFVGIKRDFRSWNIPAEIVQRNVIYEDYVYLTGDSDYIGSETALTEHAKSMILQGLTGTANNTTAESEGNLLYIYRTEPTDSNQDGAFAGVSAFAFDDSLVFSARTKDNLSVGTNRSVIQDGDDDGATICRDVYYTNENGVIGWAWLTLCPSYTNDDTDYFPACSLTKNKAGGNKIIEKLRLYLDKDPAEQVNFTYQVHFASNLPQIVIGCGWANNCPLIAPRERTVTLQKWTLTAQLPQGAQTMSSYYGTAGHDSDLNINTTDYWVEVPAKFCLTDSENNVIIANNSEATVRVYLKFTHDYESMARRNAVLFGAKYKDAI